MRFGHRRVARHENHRQVGPRVARGAGQVDPVHSGRQHHIRQQQIRRARPLQEQQRLGRRLGDEHAMPEALELTPHDLTNIGFVLDDENRPRRGGRHDRCIVDGRQLLIARGERQEHLHGGATAGR